MLEFIIPWSVTNTCLIGAAVLLFVVWLYKKRTCNSPPGPFALPILGNIFQLGADQRYHRQFFEWSKIYGPVISVAFGPINLVTANDLDTAMEVLVRKSRDFAGRQEMPSVSHWTDGFKDIAFTRYGPTWKLQRKISTRALRQYMQGRALEDRIHKALQTTLPALGSNTGVFCPEDAITFLITNILMGLCFNGEFEYGNKELRHLMEKNDERIRGFNNFIPEDRFPILQYFYTSEAMRQIDHIYNELIVNFIGRKFHGAKETFNKDKLRHFTDSLLLARDNAVLEETTTLDGLSDAHLIQTLSDIFFGGIDTSRITLYFAILHMVAFPDIQAKVQEEIDREVGFGRLPGIDDISKLCFTEAVLYESMRLSTVSPCGLVHSTMCDTTLGGYRIPKDTLVMVNLWALHHDPKAWDDVNRFKPERFLDENGKLGPKPSHWNPFSSGKRGCLGEFVARPQLLLLFAGLLQTFSWRAETGVHVDITPKGTLFLAYPERYSVLLTRRPHPDK